MSPSEGTLFSSGEEKGARSVGTVDGPVDGIQLPVLTLAAEPVWPCTPGGVRHSHERCGRRWWSLGWGCEKF